MPILNISKTLRLMPTTIAAPVALHDTPLQRTALTRSRACGTQMLNYSDNQIFSLADHSTGCPMIRYPLVFAAALAASLSLSATCVQAASIPANITAAVADSNRPDTDKQRDDNRKPAE